MLTSACHLSEVQPIRRLRSPRVTVQFPEVKAGDALRISASTYVTFKRCPGQAGARLQGVYGPDSRPGFLGSLAHRIFSRHLTSGQIPSEEFVQACREEIGGSTLNNKLGGLELRPSALASAIEEVRGRGGSELYTSWVEGEGSPEPFYRKLGFAPTGEIDDGEIVARLIL